MEEQSEVPTQRRRTALALWVFVVVMGVLCLLALGLWGVIFLTDVNAFRAILYERFTVLVALPSAVIGALVVVSLFRQAESPIKIKGLGLELEGAAGPVVLWVLCFLAMTAAIKLLW